MEKKKRQQHTQINNSGAIINRGEVIIVRQNNQKPGVPQDKTQKRKAFTIKQELQNKKL